MKTATKTAQPDLTTLGELKSHKWDDVRFRIGKFDEVAASCREWHRALLSEQHPASLTLMAAASMIDDLAETVKFYEQEIKSAHSVLEQPRFAALLGLADLMESVLEKTVDERTYPDGPCLPKEMRDEIRAAVKASRFIP